jgi:hypothetical protein
MNISDVKNIIDKAFSKAGYEISKFSIVLPSPLSVEIEQNPDNTKIVFKNKLPVVKTRKLFIPIKTELESIFFGKEDGYFKLKHFPNLKFNYSDNNQEMRFGAPPPSINLDKIEKEINLKYQDEKRKSIAKLALDYANEWANIASSNGIDFNTCGSENKKRLYDDCYRFVYENMINSKKVSPTSAALSFVILYFILPAIVNWIVKRFLNNLFNKPSMYFV